MRPLGLLALATLLSGVQSVSAQGASAFVPGRLGDIVARHEHDVQDDVPPSGINVAITANTFPTRTAATFTGQRRPISPMRAQFIAEWARMLEQNPRWAAAFTEEWQFREDGTEYWLAVQAETAASMRPLVRPETVVTLYARWLGARVEGGLTHWIFVLIAAESPKESCADSCDSSRRAPDV